MALETQAQNIEHEHFWMIGLLFFHTYTGTAYQPKECKDISNKAAGTQTIYPDAKTKLSVQCEEGGWTVSIDIKW